MEACVLAKLRRACERWTAGEKVLAHIHLAHASLPLYEEAQALRLFVAEELIETEAAPRTPSSLHTCRIIVRIRSRNAPSSTL
ncbi:MAG: hypothetical protein WCB09_00005 [Methylocella sp.]